MNQNSRKSHAKRREETRRILLDATVDCLLENGYQKSTLAKIAKVAQMTTGAVQHHFASRRELMQAALAERFFAPYSIDLAAHIDSPIQHRCKLLVDKHWQYYANPRYIAIWDIILAARHDEALMTDIKDWQVSAVQRTEKFISQLFPEFKMSHARLKNLQYFLSSQLRGLTLLNPVEDHRVNINDQLKLLTEALRQMVERKRGPESGTVI